MTKLPLTVSSKLTNLTADGSAVQLTAYANETPTAEKAPVLLAIRSAVHVDADQFANLLLQQGGQGTSAQARLALNAVASVLGALVDKYGAITVNTPFGTVQTFITGTVEDAQAQPDPETNYPFLAVVVPEVYRKLFAQYETYIPADACPAALKRVRDKATNAKGIRGTSPFYLEGHGMTIGGEGETLELLDAATREKVCDIAVDAESKSPVQFLCTLSPQTAIEAGTYLLCLTTLAGGETTLWPVDLKVELLEAVTPPEPIAESSDGAVKVYAVEDDAGASTPAGLLSAHGVLFVKGTGVTLQEGSSGPGIERDVECDLDASHGMRPGISIEQTADGISVEFGSESGTMKNGEYPDAKLVLRYYKDDAGGSPELIEVPVGIKVTMGQEDWPV